jgi:hypothetical protein
MTAEHPELMPYLRNVAVNEIGGVGETDWRIARIRLSDKTSRLHPRRAATKLGQA